MSTAPFCRPPRPRSRPVHQPQQRQRRPADDPRRDAPRPPGGAQSAPRREVGSSVYQVFDGTGTVTVGEHTWTVTRGDLFVVPSWVSYSAKSEASASDSDSGALDLFRFSDAPIFEALARSPRPDRRTALMKLATVRTADGATRAVRSGGAARPDRPRFPRCRRTAQLQDDWLDKAAAPRPRQVEAAGPGIVRSPVVPAPGKVLCVGLNYRSHILEMGRELPKYPTLFAKYPEVLIGATDEIQLPPESDAVDWEAELAVILGATRSAGPPEEQAARGDRRLRGPQRRDDA